MWAKQKMFWGVLQVVVVLTMFALFIILAPWFAAVPISDLSPDLAATPLPNGCPAVTVNHGQVHCQWLGTVGEHPVKFSLVVFAFIACWGFLVFTGRTGRGFSLRGGGKHA